MNWEQERVAPNSRQGFTLIELLVVISILGILAGIVLAVINPSAQQNKARDANLKAAISKLSLVVNSHYSAYGSYPTCTDLGSSIEQSVTNNSGNVYCTVNGFDRAIKYRQNYYGCLSALTFGKSGYRWYWRPNYNNGQIALTTSYCHSYGGDY